MRLLAQLRRNTWQCGPLTHVCGALSRGWSFEETVDDVMITCSDNGIACVWEMKDHAFQILCFLSHHDENDQLVKVNVAAAINLEVGPPQEEFRVITGGVDGCTRVWCFERQADTKQWRAFADSQAEPYGIPQNTTPDAQVYHECHECMHHHAVLSLAILPMRWKHQSSNISFNFIVGTTAGFASVYSVMELGNTPEITMLKSKVEMMHKKETIVTQVTVTSDFLPGAVPNSTCLVATCGGRGMVKLWRLSNLTDETCDVELLKVCYHTDDKGNPLMLTYAGFTPSWAEGTRRYLITSSFDDFRHERSRLFAWDPVLPGASLDKPSQTYVFRANNISFWYPRVAHKSVGRYVYCLTSAPDNSAKMFRLVNMETGNLTDPLLHGQEGFNVDVAQIEHCFMHKGPVKWVTTVQKKETGSLDATTDKKSYSLLGSVGKDGWYFVTGGMDKVANVWDPASKQCINSLRAATMSEMYLPLVLQVLTALQLISFSFKHDFKWHKRSVAPTQNIFGIVTINTHALTHLTPISPGIASLILLTFAIGMVFVFDYVILRDIVNLENKIMLQLEISQDFRKEVKEGLTGLRGMPMGPKHLKLDRASKRRRFYLEMIYLGSTVLVVPVVKTMVRFFDCLDHDESANLDGLVHGEAKWLSCQDPVYLYLRWVVLAIVICYIYLALPFTVVKGDAKVVAWKDLFDLRQWRWNAVQKSGLVHLGVMRVYSNAYFGEKLLEMAVKILVPCISFLVHPPFYLPFQDDELPEDLTLLLRACLVTALHAALLIQGLIWPVYVCESIDALFTGLKFVAFWAGFSSIVTSWKANAALWWPAMLWYAGLVLIVVLSLVIYQKRSAIELEKDMVAERHIMKEGAMKESTRDTSLKESTWKENTWG